MSQRGAVDGIWVFEAMELLNQLTELTRKAEWPSLWRLLSVAPFIILIRDMVDAFLRGVTNK